MSFEKNIFINCPFDSGFRPILRGLIFSCIYLGYEPKVSQTLSSATVRISQIKEHIKNSRFSIHDLSRNRSRNINELSRFNMPYELGLDFGCQEYGGKKLKNKKALILSDNRYIYQQFLSDISGQDIEEHNNNPQIAIAKVRNWLSANNEDDHFPSPSEIWNAYFKFYENLEDQLSNSFSSKEIEEMTISDFIKFARRWIKTLDSQQ